MANRYYNNQAFTLQPGIVKIFARVTFGAAGAPTLVQGTTFLSKGVVSVTLSATSTYTFVFGTQSGMLDVYPYLMGVNVTWDTIGTGAVPAAPLFYVSANSVATPSTCSAAIITTDKAQAATVPANGDAAWFEFTFKNSTAP